MRKIKKIWLLGVLITLTFSCCREDVPKVDTFIDHGVVEIKVGNTVIINQDEDPCEILPSSSTVFGTAERNLVQPSVYMKLGDLSPFNFKFYFEDMDFVGDFHRSRYESLKERIFTSVDSFNRHPSKNNFIVYFDYEGQRYSNSWDPETKGNQDGSYTFIRDRTGLKFNPTSVEEVWFDCPGKPNWNGFNVIRLEAEFSGPVVSQDFSDTLDVSGYLDVLISAATL